MTWLTLFNRIGPYLAVIALIAGIAGGGWIGRGWYEDSKALAEERGAQAAIDAAMARESKIAKHVQERLSQLQANQRVIDRGVIREIQKPVYRNVCLPDAGVRLLNAAAQALPAEPADQMPRDSPNPE